MTENTSSPFIERRQTKSHTFFVYVLTSIATLGGFLFGYDTGIVSGSMLLIQPYFQLTTVWQELIVSGTIMAAIVSSLLAGVMADRLGRKKTIMISSLVFVLGSVLMGVAPSKEVLLAGRIVVGVGVGLASVSVPVYVAEAAPRYIRGRLVTVYQVLIITGILTSALIAGAFSELRETGWRYMLGLAGVFGLLQFAGFFFLPESPRWLLDRGQNEAARAVLARIRDADDIEVEMADIRMSIQEDNRNSSGRSVIYRIVTTPHVRKALLIGVGLSAIAQFSGINTVIYYSGTILKMAGFPVRDAIWLVAVPITVCLLATFIGLWLVERLGRRPLLIVSVIGVILSLVVLGVGFLLAHIYAPSINTTITASNISTIYPCLLHHTTCEECVHSNECGFCSDVIVGGTCLPARDETSSLIGPCNSTTDQHTWTHGYCPNDYSWISVFGMTMFVLSFAPGLGPMPWTINSEIYPLWARSTCNSITTATVWIINFVVSMTFLTFTELITKQGTFWMYSGISVLGLIFICVLLPETKSRTLEEVEELFMREEEKTRRKMLRDAQDEKTEL